MLLLRRHWICGEHASPVFLPLDDPRADGSAGLGRVELERLPYPVALTARRLEQAAVGTGGIVWALIALKDCFESAIKYLAAILLSGDLRIPGSDPRRNETMLQKLIRPSLGVWVDDVIRPLSIRLAASPEPLVRRVASRFAARARGGPVRETALLARCRGFVRFRNDCLGHGAIRPDHVYEANFLEWTPVVKELLDDVETLSDWPLCLVTGEARAQVWMGPHPPEADVPDRFCRSQVGHFVLRGPEVSDRDPGEAHVCDLHPFLCHLPETGEDQPHYYDSVRRYQVTRKDADLLEYERGTRPVSSEPISALEHAFTRELLERAFKHQLGRMAIIEGRVTNFGELIESHAEIVGRRSAIAAVLDFVSRHDRGLLVIRGEPGKGKTALIAHLCETEFGRHSPRPVHFFYRRTAQITDPDACVKSLYHALLAAHDQTESPEAERQTDPDEVFNKLGNLLSQEIGPRLTPGRPQIIFIDALDEADTSVRGRTAFERIPEGLPAGIYIIATTRPVRERTALARRRDVAWLNLDAPEFREEDLRDGLEFVRRRLSEASFPGSTLNEIARLGAGNFLVLQLLCQHVRAPLGPAEVADFLRRLASDGKEDRLGFIYQEFWDGLIKRLTTPRPQAQPIATIHGTLPELELLINVVGLLVWARGPVTSDLVRHVLGLTDGSWDFVHRHLIQYLTEVTDEDGDVRMEFYRIYHESFADFLRARVLGDHDRHRGRLADFCLDWPRARDGFEQRYALRHAPVHLIEAGRPEEAAGMLCDLGYLEARARAGQIFDLVGDFARVAAALPPGHMGRRTVELLEEALRRDVHFIARHPETLFQCLWNSGWWYDCPALADHCPGTGKGSMREPAPWSLHGPKLSELLESWRRAKEAEVPGFVWLRSLRPPARRLGGGASLILSGSRFQVNDVSFSPDGKFIATASDDCQVRLWDASSGRELARLGDAAHPATRLGFCPEGRRIAVGDTDGGIRVLDVATGGLCWEIAGHDGAISALKFTADGRYLATGALDGTVKTWDPASGQETNRWTCAQASRIPKEHGSFARTVEAVEDNDRIVGTPVGGVRCLDLSPDARCLVVGTGDGKLELRSLGPDQRIDCLLECGRIISGVCFFPDGRRVVAACSDGTMTLVDLEAGRQPVCLSGHAEPIRSIAMDRDGRWLASASEDQTVCVWDLGRGVASGRLAGHAGSVECVAVSPDGAAIVSGSADGRAIVWNVAQAADSLEIDDHKNEIERIVAAPDGRRVASSSCYAIRVWDFDRGTLVGGLRINATEALAFGADGRRLVAAIWKETALTWDPEGGAPEVILGPVGRFTDLKDDPETKRPRVFAAFASMADRGIVDVTLSPDGCRIVAAFARRSSGVWSVQDGSRLALLQGNPSALSQGSFSPDSRRLAAAIGRTAFVWDLETGHQILALRGHHKAITGVAYSPDGTRIATISEDESLRVWDAATGVPLSCLFLPCFCGLSHELRDVAFSREGRALITQSDHGAIRLWDVPRGPVRKAISGYGDVAGWAARGRSERWLAVNVLSETAIKCTATAEEVAWFPEPLRYLQTHAGGRTWAGAAGSHLHMVTLEGPRDFRPAPSDASGCARCGRADPIIGLGDAMTFCRACFAGLPEEARVPGDHGVACASCRMTLSVFLVGQPVGALCTPCLERALDLVVVPEETDRWPVPRLIEALSASGSLLDRLAVLRRFGHALKRVAREEPGCADQLLSLAVSHLGISRHPALVTIISAAAQEACSAAGAAVVPHLLDAFDDKDPRVRSRAAMVAARLAPDDARLRPLLERGATDHASDVREQIAWGLWGCHLPWVLAIYDRLALDPVESIRQLADFRRDPLRRQVAGPPAEDGDSERTIDVVDDPPADQDREGGDDEPDILAHAGYWLIQPEDERFGAMVAEGLAKEIAARPELNSNWVPGTALNVLAQVYRALRRLNPSAKAYIVGEAKALLDLGELFLNTGRLEDAERCCSQIANLGVLRWSLENRVRALSEKLRRVRTARADQDLDAILEKISREGIGALSEEEKRCLEAGSDRFRNRGNG